MRDGSTRRRTTTSHPRTWTPERVQVQHWRERHRIDALRALADGADGLGWTRGLFNALLEELHVTDEFDRLVGPTARVPTSQYPRLIATALLLRRSWSPRDLCRIGKRIGLGAGPLEEAHNTFGCDCFSSSRRPRPRGVNATRVHVTKATTGT